MLPDCLSISASHVKSGPTQFPPFSSLACFLPLPFSFFFSSLPFSPSLLPLLPFLQFLLPSVFPSFPLFPRPPLIVNGFLQHRFWSYLVFYCIFSQCPVVKCLDSHHQKYSHTVCSTDWLRDTQVTASRTSVMFCGSLNSYFPFLP